MVRVGRELRVPLAWLAGCGPDAVPFSVEVLDARRVRHEFGGRVRFVREARGLSQVELAALLGCDGSAVSIIERGVKVTPRLSTVMRYCEALGMPPGFALADDDDLSWLEAEPWRP